MLFENVSSVASGYTRTAKAWSDCACAVWSGPSLSAYRIIGQCRKGPNRQLSPCADLLVDPELCGSYVPRRHLFLVARFIIIYQGCPAQYVWKCFCTFFFIIRLASYETGKSYFGFNARYKFQQTTVWNICFLIRRQFAWYVKAYFLAKLRKTVQTIVWLMLSA